MPTSKNCRTLQSQTNIIPVLLNTIKKHAATFVKKAKGTFSLVVAINTRGAVESYEVFL